MKYGKLVPVARQYVQQLRAETAQETRRRILDALATRLRESPTEPFSLDKIAALARVARSTIYLVFGSRAGLVEAFAEDLGDRTGVAALRAANEAPDPRDKLRGAVAAANRMYAADRPIYRALFSMRQLDPDSIGPTARLRSRIGPRRSPGWPAYWAQPDTFVRACRSTTPPTCSSYSPVSRRSTRSTPTAACRSKRSTALTVTMAERSVLRRTGPE